MKMQKWLAVMVVLSIFPFVSNAQDNNLPKARTGRAVALQVNPWNQNAVTCGDTGSAVLNGGKHESSEVKVTPVPGVSAQDLYAVTDSVNGQNHSKASLNHLDITLGSHHITALEVQTEATASGDVMAVPMHGKTTVKGLTVDGQAIAVTGEANQSVVLPDGYVLIDGQTTEGGQHFGTMTVVGVRVLVDGIGSVTVATSTAQAANIPAVASNAD